MIVEHGRNSSEAAVITANRPDLIYIIFTKSTWTWYIKLTGTLCVHCCVLLVLYYDRTISKKQVLRDSDFESAWWHEIVDNNRKMR